MLIPLLIVGIILVAIITIFIMIMSRMKTGGGGRQTSKESNVVFKEAYKKLTQNPKDPQALLTIANYYYQQGSWETAYKNYGILTEVGGSNDEFIVYSHHGMCALKLGLMDIAYKSFTVARSLRQNDFEVNFNLGFLEFQNNNYERAAAFLQVARTMNPSDAATLRYLGHTCFKMNKHKEAMTFIRQAIEAAPDDKESLYVLGECYFEAGQIEQALKIFLHLRPDPIMGASASLFAGNIHTDQRQYEKAIEDFEIGLKHDDIKPDVLMELRYKLAICYIRQNDISKALVLLKQIHDSNPTYKDVPSLITKYQELNSNKNLQIFLMGSSADFVALCRKVVMAYYIKGKVKIIDISVTRDDWIDITTEVNTPRWSDVVIFRFIRTQGVVGELILRDFQSHLKEFKAGKGICIIVGTFSEEAKRFTEARLIDLIEKDKFVSILKKVEAHTPVSGTKR
ncbi:MAG: tetratricopeptide repeat protein [Treponema sp.]|jgi:tetratricopeptide (TPR) repeat protein|nr:tetratricopeptide repeat protein [Treponema sp.]